MSLVPPCIPGNPDISGIGVRAAIYIQNLLSLIPAISALWDGEVASYELESVETQTTTILITAFGILISAMYKSQVGPQHTKSTLYSWVKVVRDWFSASVASVDSLVDDPKGQEGSSYAQTDRTEHHTSRIRGIVAILGSLHLTLMSVLGIWLWNHPVLFGMNIGTANACALELSSYVILGVNVPLRSNVFRMASIVVYAIFLAPVLNLLLPMFVFLGILFLYRSCPGTQYKDELDPSPRRNLLSARNSTVKIHRSGYRSRSLILALREWYNPFVFPTVVGMALLFAINIVFIIDTELTLRRNRHLRTAGESAWTFGQILAILLWCCPFNAVRWHASTDILWNLVRRGADVNVKAEVLLLAVGARRDVEFTQMLLAYGANPDVTDVTDSTALQAACSYASLPIVRLLLASGADPNIEGGEYGTALQAASCSGNAEIVRLLLKRGADVNIQGGKYASALKAASERGYSEIIELLRAHGATR
ncbi:ankyrin repeat-containing domain protein [Mycena leptocephala]|nr:ankyrin repeat-containing domain protein [Mycena leptocephala]